MATILDEVPQAHISIIKEIVEDISQRQEPSLYNDDDNDPYILSVWVKEKDIIRPSGDITIMKQIEPGTYVIKFDNELGIYCQKINFSSDELFTFSDSITSSLLKEVELFWDKSNLYTEKNLIHKRGILLEGFPGTGKTSIITQLSNNIIERGGIVFIISGFRNLENYITFIKTAFRKIQPDTPIVTILEDINQYVDIEPDLLDFLDGKNSINHHIVIATSNNTEDISDALLRPSRIDLCIEINNPSEQTRREFFKFKNTPADIVEELVSVTKNCSLAELKEIYICICLLDYSIEDALIKVLEPRDKKNYSFKSKRGSKITL